MALAIFDLDDTLIHGDCASLWSQHMADLGWVDGPRFLEEDGRLMAGYAKGQLSMEDYMAFSLRPLIGRSPAELAEVVQGFVESVIYPRIYQDARHSLNLHREAGDRLLVISASGAHLVKPIAEQLGINEVLAIDLDVQNGQFTGRTSGILTYREGKVQRLLAWLEGDHQPLASAHFYSDSRNDLPLLSQVAHPHAVNPDPVLKAHAEEQGWEILHWQ